MCTVFSTSPAFNFLSPNGNMSVASGKLGDRMYGRHSGAIYIGFVQPIAIAHCLTGNGRQGMPPMMAA